LTGKPSRQPIDGNQGCDAAEVPRDLCVPNHPGQITPGPPKFNKPVLERCYLIPEFQRGVLDSLRQPIESGEAVVARANAHVRYPARFQLVAAMNPCRCGYLSDPAQACSRAPKCAADYQSRISGPLFDRIDLHVEVPGVMAADLALPPPAEGSAEVAARVAKARDIQRARFEGEAARTNAEAEGELLDRIAAPEPQGVKLLTEAAERMRLSARGYSRVLRVARTIADLSGAPHVLRPHIAEALSYRRLNLQN
jgi:magnesium chelatase family protein